MKSVVDFVVTKQKVTEWEIAKTGIGNEMEIFITLTKYNTRQRCEEGNHCSWWRLCTFLPPPLTIVSNLFIRNGTHSLMFIGRVYNRSFIHFKEINVEINSFYSRKTESLWRGSSSPALLLQRKRVRTLVAQLFLLSN